MKKLKYTKKQVERAGKKLLCDSLLSNKKEFTEVMDILSFWRFSHEKPLEKAFKLLQVEVKKVEKNPIFGKRLKRQISISSKLQRFEKMSLKNMQDIGGCRAVVANQKKIRKIIRGLKKHSEFKTKEGNFRTKDYIKTPKKDGYRSYHIVGRFSDQFEEKRQIEIQLRTYIQHYWATALEIVDLFTNQALKSNQGDAKWAELFKGTSSLFELIEDIPLFYSLSPKDRWLKFSKVVKNNRNATDLCKSIKKLIPQLRVIQSLEAYANSLQIMNKQIESKPVNGYVILVVKIKKNEGEVLIRVFTPEEAEEAEREYIQQEKNFAGENNIVVAMVLTSSMEEVKNAYPNYFADSSSFITLLQLIKTADI